MNVLEEAHNLIHGQRRDDYGHPIKSFTNIAKLWSAILGIDVEPEQVALCMIALKISRYSNSATRDSLVDIAGYAGTIELLGEKKCQQKLEKQEADT